MIKQYRIAFAIIIFIFMGYLLFQSDILLGYRIKYLKPPMNISSLGLELLNAYELPNYLLETNDEGKTCMKPYNVGDGVITFGAGVTYENEKDGLDDINKILNTNYSIENNCIVLKDLYDLQEKKLDSYEWDTWLTTREYKFHLTQNEFDALLLLDYNSPNILDYQSFINVILNDGSKLEYQETANDYYQQFEEYKDNPETKQKNDGFGEGWYNRIVDSSEVYYDDEYEFQNSI